MSCRLRLLVGVWSWNDSRDYDCSVRKNERWKMHRIRLLLLRKWESGVTSDAKQSSETQLYRFGGGLALSVGSYDCASMPRARSQLNSAERLNERQTRA